VQEDVKQFFEAYRDAFSREPRAVAEFYSAPCLIARMGSVRLNATREDVESLFADIDAKYRSRGFTHAAILAQDIQQLGANSVLATVHWAYMGAQDQTLWEAIFSYNLYKCEDGLKILLLTLHDA